MRERRRLVVGFGVNARQCGWAATADLVRYDLKRRSGEWESTYVGAAGRVQQVIVVDDHNRAVELRDYLNSELHRAAGPIVEKHGLARRTVDVVQLLLEVAWRFDGTEHGLDLAALVWQVVDAPAKELEGMHAFLMDALAKPGGGTASSRWWSDPGLFPFTAIVFDLDQTLVDSSRLPTAEARRRWAHGGEPGLVTEIEARGSIVPHELPGLFLARDVPVGVATRSPRPYAERVLAEFGVEIDVLHAGSRNKAASIRECARDLGANPAEIVVIGDDESDIRAARELNATSLGAVWGRETWDDRMQPDISVVEPSLLLEHANWSSLTYLAEQHDLELEPVIHAGSWITYGGLQTYALGRYFISRNPRHDEFLTQAILQGKAATDPEPAIARALSLLGGHIRDHAAIDVVTSVPGSSRRADRFAEYREIAADAFAAADEMVIVEERTVGSLKGIGHEARAALNEGRFTADSRVEGLHVLVLDDVITSGSTLKACAEALRDAGAAEVSCVSFAGTQD